MVSRAAKIAHAARNAKKIAAGYGFLGYLADDLELRTQRKFPSGMFGAKS
jgi:hypothetical protein